MIRAITFLLVIYFSTNLAFTQESTSPDQIIEHTEEKPATIKSDDANNDAPFAVGQPTKQETTPVITKTPTDSTAKTEPTTDANNTNNIPAAPENKSPEDNYTTGVLLQGLNKITARTSKLEVKIDQPIKFGNLSITLHSCWKSPPEEAPESKALLEMWEEIPGEERKKIFSGWMFASSPLISAPEHPVYDITVLECRGSKVESRKVEKENQESK